MTTPEAAEPIEIEPGTPLARAVTRGQEAAGRKDIDGVDVAYREAYQLATNGDPAVRSAVAVDHVVQLLALGAATTAGQRCAEYLAAEACTQPDWLTLRLLGAQALSSATYHHAAALEVAAISRALGRRMRSMPAEYLARLHRVAGLAAADRDDLDGAAQQLAQAQRLFLAAGHRPGVEIVDRDRLLIEVRIGAERAVSEALSGDSPQTVAEHLRRAVAFKRELRYEEALWLLLRCVAEREIDQALRLPVLIELSVLLQLTRHDEAASQLLPLVHEAAAESPDPAAGQVLARLTLEDPPEMPASPRFDDGVQHARQLIVATRLDEAESLLHELRSRARTGRDVSTWHLAAGELELAGYGRSGRKTLLREAALHFGRAADQSTATSLLEVRMLALRQLGRACIEFKEQDLATASWSQAHRIEERIANRQITDAVRVEMLAAAPDEHDELIEAAVRALGKYGNEAAAAVVVAMEAARGATILRGMLPDEVRDLPQLSDLDGAWRWLYGMTRDLPPSQAIWIMHATPHRVHHAVVGRGMLRYASVPVAAASLEAAVDELMACWSPPPILEMSVESGEFDECLTRVAGLVGVDVVIPAVPRHVRRVAIVAGGVLADVPFAALAMPEGLPIGHRFALSYLPCLSARRPLHHRSRRQRGERAFLVSPPNNLTPATNSRDRAPLDGDRATVAGLAAALGSGRHQLVRLDAHGEYDHGNSARSWIQLAPKGPQGRLDPELLQSMDLRGCGTLVLGACESGMGQRRGRDERTGFVRAAVRAGAASVVAARWLADDPVAAAVLDQFERFACYLTRDVALQYAQRHASGAMTGAAAHPASWACWTLYGDAGWQTGAGPVRRLLRRNLDVRRRNASG